MFSVSRIGLWARSATLLILTCMAAVALTSGLAEMGQQSLFLFSALWILAVLALLAARSAMRRHRASRPLLLSRRALRRPPMPLPPLRQMRAELDRLLASPGPQDIQPESPEHAIRRILERGFKCQNAREATDLSVRAVTEFWLLLVLLRASPDRAGGLARCFRQPDKVLELHDRVSRVAVAHAAAPAMPLARSA